MSKPECATFTYYVPVSVTMSLDDDGEHYSVDTVLVDDSVPIKRELTESPWIEGESDPELLDKLIADAEDGQAWPSWGWC